MPSHKVRDPEILLKFGERFKAVRKRQSMTQEELAYKSNVALSSIARIETGKLNATIGTIVVLAESLGVDKRELLDF